MLKSTQIFVLVYFWVLLYIPLTYGSIPLAKAHGTDCCSHKISLKIRYSDSSSCILFQNWFSSSSSFALPSEFKNKFVDIYKKPCSDGRGHAQQNFNPIFCWWVEPCSLPAIYLGPNYGGGNEDNGDLLQMIPCMYCNTQCPKPCSRPPPTHASSGDSWTLIGRSGWVSRGVTAPFSWVLEDKFLFVLSKSLCKFWQLYGGVNGDLLQEGLCHTQIYCT